MFCQPGTGIPQSSESTAVQRTKLDKAVCTAVHRTRLDKAVCMAVYRTGLDRAQIPYFNISVCLETAPNLKRTLPLIIEVPAEWPGP